MIFAALQEAADKGELILVDGGLCRWHKRRDGTTVIRELLVLPHCRNNGIGWRLVANVIATAGIPVLAKCPASYVSNGFWRHLGFQLIKEEGTMNTWEYRS